MPSSRRTSSWTRRPAAGATRTSSSSGRARCTISRRSITSSTASRSSICSRSWGRSRANGAPAATITRYFSTGASNGQSKNRSIRDFDYFMTFLNPVPHKRTFMKPFMRMDSAEFCSACHKVHLDVPVNNYRWFRGFNDYDNWQASGFGEGARSFYYPPKGQACLDCHMPLVPSKDPGNHSGEVHSHRFPGANLAVSYANRDQAQMGAAERFLKSGFITVDIFAVSPVEENAKQTVMVRRASDQPQVMSAA